MQNISQDLLDAVKEQDSSRANTPFEESVLAIQNSKRRKKYLIAKPAASQSQIVLSKSKLNWKNSKQDDTTRENSQRESQILDKNDSKSKSSPIDILGRSKLSRSEKRATPSAQSVNLHSKSTQNVQSQKQERNIFVDTENEIMLKSNWNKLEFDNGPRYDANGKVIPRTIIGSAQLFMKKQMGEQNIGKRNLKKTTIFKPQYKKSPRSSSKFSSIALNNQSDQQVYTVIKNKQDTLQELEKIRDRIKQNIDEQKQKLSQIPFVYRQEQLREQRAFEEYQNAQKNWQELVERESHKLKRNAESHNIIKSDKIRIKKEYTDIFEFSRNDFEKFGSQVWQATVKQKRYNKSLQEMDLPFLIMDEKPHFQVLAFDVQKKKACEIVRKPKLTDLAESLKNSSFTSKKSSLPGINSDSYPFQKIDTQNYYKQRLREVQQDIKKVLPIQDTQIEYEDLYVIGTDKFQQEVDFVKNADKNQFFVKKVNKKTEKDQEELIGIDLQKNYVMMHPHLLHLQSNAIK